MAKTSYSILITGGAGYLGSTLTPHLLAHGHKVTVLDNFMHRQTPLNQLCADPNFDVVRGDSRDEAVLKPLVAKADIIIPMAAIVGAPACNADKTACISTNKDAVATLAKISSMQQRILIPTTNSGYGVGQKDKFCTEETPINPISLYGTTKMDAEKIVLDRGNGISFRLATVFGMSPRMRMDLLVNDFVYRAITDRAVVLFEPHFKRNYIHVRDVAGAFHHGIDKFDTMKQAGVFNVGLSEANLSKFELCQAIQKHLPGFVFMEAPIGEDPDKRDYIVSNARMEGTGWKPQVTLEGGIQELIKGYRMMRPNPYTNL
ncbi:MAG: NAD(P)-dependent oxidoreductase, partial [Alphaproteobacteria bacterium]|nr:NAD(P)-dependent oxidoreductase [Alphaproteobacteria bacterium]